tara:strand:+ start:793 stop:1167 length:375 start_codon:yes stop_codon:yes gene_type:complete
MNDESSQIKSILSTLQKIMPTIIDGETKKEMKSETEMKTETKSETRVFSAVGPTSEGQEKKEGTDIVADTDADTENQAAIVVDGHSFLNTPLADNEIRKEEYTIVMNADGKNEIIDSKTEKIIL